MSEDTAGTRESSEKSAPAGGPQVSAAVSWDALLSTYLPAMILALGTGIALPALPTLAKSFGVSFGLASGVVTAFLIGNLVGTIPSGWLIDRFGRRPVLIAGPLLTAAMGFLVAGTHSFTRTSGPALLQRPSRANVDHGPASGHFARRRTRSARTAGQLDVRHGQHGPARRPGAGRVYRRLVGLARTIHRVCSARTTRIRSHADLRQGHATATRKPFTRMRAPRHRCRCARSSCPAFRTSGWRCLRA